MKNSLFLFVMASLIVFSVNAQDFQMPRHSPTTTIKQEFSTSFIQLDYSRPSVKDRVIFGHIVPYNEVWRTGANATTKITFGENVIINDRELKAGEYAFYTIPGEKEWEIVFNFGKSEWTNKGFDKKDDLVRFSVASTQFSPAQESFSIFIDDLRNNSCSIVLRWETTEIRVPVKADNNQRILAWIDEQLKTENPPYNKITGYYIATSQRLESAVDLQKKAIEENPKAYFLHWHLAEIYYKLGRFEEAEKTAKKAAELAKGGAYEVEYEQHYQDILNREYKW